MLCGNIPTQQCIITEKTMCTPNYRKRISLQATLLRSGLCIMGLGNPGRYRQLHIIACVGVSTLDINAEIVLTLFHQKKKVRKKKLHTFTMFPVIRDTLSFTFPKYDATFPKK